MPDVTYFVLGYGNYPQLFRRCLHSLHNSGPSDVCDRLRIGLNEPSQATLWALNELTHDRVPQHNIYISSENIHKYPLMRRLFYDPSNPVTTEFTCWFDDDSYIRHGQPRSWETVMLQAARRADMIGAIYTIGLGGNQHLWVQDQPWYTGRPVPAGHRVSFATGGWWCIRTELLHKHDWPPPAFDHRGGDVMLGELCRQQHYRLDHFNHGVAINADGLGRESKADKRGFDSKPIGYYYQPGQASIVQQATAPRIAARFLNLDL